MPMTTAQREAMIASLEADQFAPLDLNAFPNLKQPAPEPKDDGRFAKHWTETPLNASAAALRAFVADPDTETLERVGQEIGNEDFSAEVRDRRGEEVAVAFKRANPAYIMTDNNHELMVNTLAFNALSAVQQQGTIQEMTDDLIAGGFWTVGNLTACFRALADQGLLDVPAGTPRNLSDKERLHVIRLAQVGRTGDALNAYLSYSLDGEEVNPDILNEPDYEQVTNEAVFTVFEASQADYAPTREREQFLLRFAGRRPLTLGLLQAAWRACQANEQKHERGQLLTAFQQPEERQPPTERQLDELDDSQVDRLYHDSLKKYAQQFRRPQTVAA